MQLFSFNMSVVASTQCEIIVFCNKTHAATSKAQCVESCSPELWLWHTTVAVSIRPTIQCKV